MNPPPEPAKPAPSQEKGLGEEDANHQAVQLVLDFRPAGKGPTVAERLQPELEQSLGGSPWVVQRLDEDTALVTFRPYGEALGNAPVYEFEVDMRHRLVAAAPETAQALLTAPGLADSR